MIRHNLRDKLETGGSLLGPALQIPSAELVEIVGLAGFDFVLLDGEHGSVFQALVPLIIAADSAGIAPVVRVPSHERSFIQGALEAGAAALHVPMINSVDDALRLVEEAKYPPLGRRGFSAATRAASYGASNARHLAAEANQQRLLIISIETLKAAEQASGIAAVPGLDLMFIGPGDLAADMGVPQSGHAPEVREVMLDIIREVDGRIPLGTSVFSQRDAEFWRAQGMQYFLTSSTNPIRLALETLQRELRAPLQD